MASPSDSETRSSRLRALLHRPEPTVLMEAHNGLSAILAEEAGFEAIWASGLAISSALGVRDSNEASWTQVIEVLEFMADAVSVPILLDGDTGYGNFNSVRRLVRKLEQRGVAGVCLEDKLFPKTNSFLDGGRQSLAEIDEFCGKLRAAKDTQQDADFVVVARTEALITGWGLDEALLRATAYADAGADAVLVHSSRDDADEVRAFAARWDGRVPLVVVPTKYPTVPLADLVSAGITNVIFANQSLRTVITALQTNLAALRSSLDLMSIEHEIAPVSEVFRLQNVDELRASEERYLPASRPAVTAVVLAATQGDFGVLVENRPKAMLPLHGRPVLAWHAEAFRRQGIRRVGVVRGFAKEAVDLPGLEYVDNDDYASTLDVGSLASARHLLTGPLVVAYGDIVFDDFILSSLLAADGDVRVAVDVGWRMRSRTDPLRDLARSRGHAGSNGVERRLLEAIGTEVSPEGADGEWVGLVATSDAGTLAITELLDRWSATDPVRVRTATLPQLLQELVDTGTQVTVTYTYGHWYDLDDQRDLLQASEELPR